MTTLKLNNIQLENAVKKTVNELDSNIKSHSKDLFTTYDRMQFEKWFYSELFNRISNELKEFDVKVKLTSKQSNNSTEITILQDNEEFIGLQLSTILLNHPISGFSSTTKGIPEIVDNFIGTINNESNYLHSYSLAIVIPYSPTLHHEPLDEFSRNVDSKKANYTLSSWGGVKTDEFITRYYLLYNGNNF